MPKRKLGWRKTPKYECVGCGYCCLAVPCFHSARRMGHRLDVLISSGMTRKNDTSVRSIYTLTWSG
jgi:Fe-S-cluster-containing dehydrogenase component